MRTRRFGTIKQAIAVQRKGNPMSYRILFASLAAAILVIAWVSTEAFARGGARAGGAHAGGARAGAVHARGGGAYRGTAARGTAYRGAAYRGTAYRGGAYVRRGVGAAAVGAAAYGAATAPYYNGACGYYPNPPCY